MEDNRWSSAPKAQPFAFLPEKQRSPGWKGRLSARPFNQTVILEQGWRPRKTAASQHAKQTRGGLLGESSSRTAGRQAGPGVRYLLIPPSLQGTSRVRGGQHEPQMTLSPPFKLLFQATLELAAAASFSDSAVISGEFMAFPSCQP